LEFCFAAVVTDNSRDTTDRNQTSCILERYKIYDISIINLFKKWKTCTVFLLSYRNTSGSLGEREMLMK